MFRNVLIAPYAIALLQRTVATHLGLHIKIGQFGGSYFTNIEIKNVTTEKRMAEGTLADLHLRNLKVTYRLWDLLKGFPTFVAGTSIEMGGGVLSIDLTAETDSGDGDDAVTGIILPQHLPQVRIKNSSILVKGAGYETRFMGISLVVRHDLRETSRLRLHIAEWHLNHPALRNIAVGLETDIIYSNKGIRLNNLFVGNQPLVESAAIDLGGLPERIPFQAMLNLVGGRLEASGQLAANRLQVQFSGSDIDLGRISGLLVPQALPFGGRFTVQGQLDLPLEEPQNIVGDLTVQVSKGSVNGTTVQQLAFRLTANDRHLRILDFELVNDANRITISKASAPAEVVFAADLDALLRSLSVDWRLECANIPSLLNLVGVVQKERDYRIPNHLLILSGQMENSEVIIPNGRLKAASGHIHLHAARIALPVGDRALRDSPLVADLSVELPNVEVLSGIFALRALGGSIKGRIQVTGSLADPRGTANITCQSMTYQDKLIGNLAIQAKAQVQGITVESAFLERGKDRAFGRGTINLAQKSFENVNVELDVSDLYPYLSELLPLIRRQPGKSKVIHGRLQARLKLSGPFAKPVGSMNLQSQRIRIEGTLFGDADVDLAFSDEHIKVSSMLLRNLNDRLHLSGSIHHKLKQLNNVNLMVEISDLAAYNAPWLQAGAAVSGSLKGRLQASGDLVSPDAEADLSVENLHFNHIQIKTGVAKLKSTNRLITIESAELKMAQQRIQLAGDIQRNLDDTEFEIKLKEATFIRESALLALEHVARCRLFRNGRIIFNDVALAGSAGRLSVDGSFDPQGNSNLLITVSDLRGDGWFDILATDRVRFQGLDARIKLSGRADAPSFTVDGSLENLGGADIPMVFSGRFKVAYGNRSLKIHEFEWSGRKGQQIHLSGAIPIDPFRSNVFAPGKIALTGRAHITDASVFGFIFPWAEDTGGSIQCDLKLTGTWAHPSGTLHLAMKDLKRPGDIKPLPPGPYTVNGAVRVNNDLVSLELFEAHSSGWKVSVQGQWTGAPTPVDVLRSPKPPLTGRINLAGYLEVSDLSWLAHEVDGVRRLTGRLEAQGVLQGPITAPNADAVVKLWDAELAPNADMPSLRGLNLETTVTPEMVTVEKLTAELGGAPFELKGTWKMAAINDSAADLRVKGENLLLFRGESLRLRADTDLTLKGPVSRLELAGETAITDGHFSKNLGILEGLTDRGKPDTEKGFQLFSIREAPLRDMTFNVRITAREPFRIQNNLVRGSVRPDLVLSGTGEVPVITGKVYVEPTRFYLPAGRMKLETGIIRFDPSDPNRPKLDMVGTTKMLGYDITAVVDGPYDEPVITLSSVPPLPNEDLVMLLLTGQPPKKSGLRDARRSQQMNVAMFLGRDMISRLFGGESEEASEFIMDRFDVEIGRGVTQQGEETIHAQFRLADDILRKGDSLYLTGERDYFDYYNAGVRIVFRFR